jgi:hypothetical protein
MITATEITTATATHANLMGYTDITPYEVIRVVSAKCIEVREMNAEMCADYKPEFIPGGFSAHCTNNHQQRYDYSSNPERGIVRIRLSVRKGCRPVWRDANGSEYRLSMSPRKHYDYNF